jgi:DNA-binding LacI/PurR family transcriptional regulator
MEGEKHMSATIEDVARRAEVSIRTVSRVINNRPDVAESTRERVLRAIAELNYRPNSLAQSMVTGSTKTIGVVLPDISNPFFGRAIRGCEDVLAEAGYSIFLCNTDEDLDKEHKYLTLLVSRQVDGMILWGPADCDTFEALLDPVPVVMDCAAFCGNVEPGCARITRARWPSRPSVRLVTTGRAPGGSGAAIDGPAQVIVSSRR